MRLVKQQNDRKGVICYAWVDETGKSVALIDLHPEGLVEFNQFGDDCMEVGIEHIGEPNRQVYCADDEGTMDWS